MISRRLFLLRLASAAGAALVLPPHKANAESILAESDPLAQAQGYHMDASTVELSRFPDYRSASSCANCALLVSRRADGWGRCATFAEKAISLRGWCRNHTQKKI
ncbi:MAG: high-potential iron-sulfur protein [Burkholderiaceae bacterium]|jgi:hypothetical protein